VIDKELADIVVLDGQHRTNAFRFMANEFPDATGDKIYSVFYTAQSPCKEFDAELPVTIVWFEGDNPERPISPTMISRKLFVDVNSNAQEVSESRTILLSDTRVTSVATSTFYSELAQHGFDVAHLSLLHSGFDYNMPGESEASAPTLFFPTTIEYMMRMLLLAPDSYDNLDYEMGADHSRDFRTTTIRRMQRIVQVSLRSR